jgi:hypothetical protein
VRCWDHPIRLKLRAPPAIAWDVPPSLGRPRPPSAGAREYLDHAVLVALGLMKRMAERLMRDFPQNGTARQVTVNFVTGGEGDIRVTVAQLHEEPSSSHSQ